MSQVAAILICLCIFWHLNDGLQLDAGTTATKEDIEKHAKDSEYTLVLLCKYTADRHAHAAYQ